MKKLVIAIIGWLVLGMAAQAESFDCAKARTKVEHMICDNPDISKLDDELAVSYKSAMQDKSKAEVVRYEQKQWMKERNNCSDANCVKRAYQTRLHQLSPITGQDGSSAKLASAATNKPAGKYVLRATSGLRDNVDYSGFCTAFTANLNQFRDLKFDTCSPRLSSKFPRFSRPQWEEIPLDMDMVKRILTNRPSIGFKRWFKVYKAELAAGEVKLWRTRVDLLKDGNLDTLIRLDHAGDGTHPYCSYFDSKQMIVDIPDPNIYESYVSSHFDNLYRLAGDMIYDANTKRYFFLDYRHVRAMGEGINLADIGASSSVMVYGANKYGVLPVCWIDWVQTGKRNSRVNRVIHN